MGQFCHKAHIDPLFILGAEFSRAALMGHEVNYFELGIRIIKWASCELHAAGQVHFNACK